MWRRPSTSVSEFKGDDLYLLFDCPTELADKKAAVVGTADLGVPRIVDETV